MSTWNADPNDPNNQNQGTPEGMPPAEALPEAPAWNYAEASPDAAPPPPSQFQPPSEQQPMIRCEVTGKLVPAEDAVEFQGRMVSAEGKNLLLRSLMGGQSTSGILIRPSFWRRLGCTILDNIIVSIVVFPTVVVTTIVLLQFFPPSSGGEGLVNGVGQVLSGIISVAYFTIFHAIWGKSLGKMAGRYRVVNMADGSPISFSTALFRAFWFAGIYMIPGLAMMIWMPAGLVIGLIAAFYGLGNSLALVIDSEYNRALHDRLAGTRVVMDD